MQILDLLRQRFAAALSQLFTDLNLEAESTAGDDPITEVRFASFSQMVRPATDPRHGDYQANCAMPLAKIIGPQANSRGIAEQIVARLKCDDLCLSPEIAGPGFINLRLTDSYLGRSLNHLLTDPRVGVSQTAAPQTIVIDYSGPNVAKPMHVGHIRSTVIGDSLAKVLRFLGHRVITDNHLGDWGTQFGMVIYGFKHFGDEIAFAAGPVAELSRLYKQVNRLIAFHAAIANRASAKQTVVDATTIVRQASTVVASAADVKDKKQAEKSLTSAQKKLDAAIEAEQANIQVIETLQNDASALAAAQKHPGVAQSVLEETVKLHQGDVENLALWNRFLPYCKDEINRIYERLNIQFDHTLGESFYHGMLSGVVSRLRHDGLASDSEGAVCVFLPEFDAPMIVQKRDGAFLYATTDLATIIYRHDEFRPDEVLYVVDARQSEHFGKLFAVARHLGFEKTRFHHVSFGTVLGDDGKPFKTRSGSSVGLESLLDDAVARAFAVVCNPERSARMEPPLGDVEMRQIANVVGHGAIKFADLSHHRSSDYKFDLEKMVALDGNTSAYIQYAYARVQGILSKGETDENSIVAANPEVVISHPAERLLVLQLLRFGESLDLVRADYAPNFLVDSLYETARAYAVFNDGCPVLKGTDEATRNSRLAIVASTGRVLRTGLNLLGIDVVARM